MRRPSPSCGRCSAPGSTARSSWPPTTLRSTGASCTPAAPGTGCARHGRDSPARFNLPGRNGESARRSCPTSVAGSAFRCCTTTPRRMQRHAHESCSPPRPRVGVPAAAPFESRTRIRGEAGSAQSRTSRTRAAPRPHELDIGPRPESGAMIFIGNCPPRPQRLRWRAVALTLQTWWRRLRETIRQTGPLTAGAWGKTYTTPEPHAAAPTTTIRMRRARCPVRGAVTRSRPRSPANRCGRSPERTCCVHR